MVSHIIGRIKGGKGFQPVIDPNGVKGQNFPVLLGEVNIVRAIGGGAFLFIKAGVVFRTLKLDLGHLVIGQIFVMLDHVLQRGIKLIQRVNFCQIHVAVPNGNIAFLVHVAKIAQFNLIGLILRGKMDDAHRIVQTVHAVIGDLFNDEGHA